LETDFVYIKVVVIASLQNRGKRGKVQVTTVFISTHGVSKRRKSVGKRVYEFHIKTTSLTPLRKTNRLKKRYPQKTLRYPQLSTTYPHLGGKGGKNGQLWVFLAN